ncbi:MAG TPA: MBL fold metallo-hydrolase [Marmoricola sp.]|nr:MBL fold metallo-hydrolase [Marmoricola sp.]
MTSFTEVGDRVWVARHEWYDVNITAVEGESGVLVVDTHASSEAAREVIDALRRVTRRPVTALVNTHDHFDHWFGNSAFTEVYGDLPIIAHETCVELMADSGATVQQEASSWTQPRSPEVAVTRLVPATRSFSSASTIDLGDRVVELVHPGRGHTAGDLVVRIGDADVVLAGDLVEESADPSYGSDCHPLEWPGALDLVLGLVGAQTVVVPGHGAPVDSDFVAEQHDSIAIVARTIQDLAGRGVGVDRALEEGEWPYPRASLTHAVRRGYEQLPRSARQLPLL